MEQFISTIGVDRIAGLDEPVLRNLQITQSYHVLSSAFVKRTGPCANWCTFATWASKQAGQTIRREDLARALEDTLKTSPAIGRAISGIADVVLKKSARLNRQGISKLVWEALNPGAALERSSMAVARGNQKVFAEIGREFARFIATCLDDKNFDAGHLAQFCATLRPGDPPDGQQYLRQAFSHYYQAFFEPDTKARVEYMLLANLEIGFHEQTRLQPEIAEALEASAPETHQFKHRLLKAVFPKNSWIEYLGSLFRRVTGLPTPLDIAIAQFLTVVKQHLRRSLTEHLMVLCFPKGVHLRLRSDLKAAIPPQLRQLVNPELRDLLKRIDPTPDSLRETGAVDWANLPDRIHFIADLFRCYHETADLLTPPFEPEQVKAISDSQVPVNGKL